jgi:hypothetical protein
MGLTPIAAAMPEAPIAMAMLMTLPVMMPPAVAPMAIMPMLMAPPARLLDKRVLRDGRGYTLKV